jgi:uncharacterized protein with gpF-like domain
MFTVAKAMHIDILKDIRGAVDDALKNGTTFEDLPEAAVPCCIDKGWWGKKEMVDPAPATPRSSSSEARAGSA